jgi:hypothetical protein
MGNTKELCLSSPADVVAAVPYVLGFHPDRSLVLLGADSPTGTFAVRLDLADDTEELDRAIEHTIGILRRRGCETVVLIGYGRGDRVSPVIDLAREQVRSSGLWLLDALRVEAGRFWSYLCTEPGCCPAEGTSFDITTSVVAAQATAQGLVALPDRSELERIVNGRPSEPVVRAAEEAEQRLAERFVADPETSGDRMVTEGLALVRDLIDRAFRGNDPPSDDEVGRLGLLLTHLRVRDEAWVRIDDDHLDEHVAFWADLVRRVPDPYVAAPACLLAFAAWRKGDGALANVALARGLAARPEYSMGNLLHELFISGVPPGGMSLGMTPDLLDDDWAEPEM